MFLKILLTVAVVAFIWFGFKFLGRSAELRRREEGRPVPSSSKEDTAGAETMVECRVCGTWQPSRSARSCGRGDCPY
ncbi:hypothetical protein CCC_03619 [Paramagnetospirillum magnetotacticum MS-1]|uniref:Uncharacterized protein n=1 Tax=Paramagnetospirillum magnetotacticum MS-1 TaxID=272627 RepID=A0A0C2UZT1_PARME|nr:hypothetical protein [Paramagnetospirillum magnetotacticum]KIL98336.1 hypothetical protein CCC_03619 [Paramagnetospirillum magnetotacticum MS-1]